MSQIGAISGSYSYGGLLSSMSSLYSTQEKQSLATLAGESLLQIDTSGTGSISESEFEQAFAQATSDTTGTSTPSAATNAAADALFQKIDTNGDGQLSADEWNAFQQNVQAHQSRGHHHHAQASGAADSGSTSGTQSATQTLQSLAAQLYQSAGISGNGQTSQNELANWLSGSLALL